jgi:N-formylglutamate amidohydrolase
MRQIEYSETLLVSRHQGTLPVLLTCAHDGEEQPPGVPDERTGVTPGCPPFRTRRDARTREITTGIAQQLLELTGEAPSVAIAEFSRRFIDANRSAECAFEDPDAQQFYDEYHNTIRQFIGEIRAENGGLGLLFDIHGTAGIPEDPADLYLGTDDGKTIDRLRRADPRVLWRRRCLRGFLEAAGYVVSPRQPDIPETPAVSGGFTVRTYGSFHADGLDAIQIEIDEDLRNGQHPKKSLQDLIEDLAQAIARLAVLWADAHTLATFRSIDLVTGELAPVVAGQLRPDADAGDWLLRLGGEPQNRGRVEIRREPGAGTRRRRAGVLVLCGEDGNDHFLWVDNEGRLRIASSDPGTQSHAGRVVGAQT